MANDLFKQLGGGNSPQNDGGFGQMMQAFNQFRQNFQGDPRQKVQELLNSGKMSQQQYNQLSDMARRFRSFMDGGNR